MSDLSPEAQDLLERARNGDDPVPGDRQRIRRALGASLAAGAGLGAAAQASAAAKAVSLGGAVPAVATGGKIATWVAVGALAGASTATAALWVSTRLEPSSPHGKVSEERAREPSRSGRFVGGETDSPSRAPAIEEKAREPAGLRTIEPVVPPRVSAAALAQPSSLGAETTLLATARAALGRGDAAGALALLSEHERTFPAGTLVEERLASQVFALCGLGRRAEAARIAAELLRKFPSSPQRARVLDSCAYRPPPP